MCGGPMARKDDPVYNVRFVQLVEGQPSLWNYTSPGYSKKEEVQRAWQQVANEIKDTVRNCRERWRTIRSSFLRSLKLARTQTGSGKRKYYLSKYLQFLIPYTKSRSGQKQLGGVSSGGGLPAPAAGMVLRKPGGSAPTQGSSPPEEEDPEELEPEDQTKEMPLDVQVSEVDEEEPQDASQPAQPLRLQAIKLEQPQTHLNSSQEKMESLVTVPAAALGNHMDWSDLTQWFKGGGSTAKVSTPPPPPPAPATTPALCGLGGLGGLSGATSGPLPLSVPLPLPSPDADYSFLISLHPYLKEMSGKQNRRFRQKVVALIDDILDNVDT
ncbi:hypothetical protein KR018_004694 [Drosophila ironensis]|nr:hypothetical protein KR018_004694 [Drosophila ironensis]